MSRSNPRLPARRRLATAISVCAATAMAVSMALASAGPVLAHTGHGDEGDALPHGPASRAASAPVTVDPEEAATLGKEHAEEHARTRMAMAGVGEYPQTTRTERLKALTASQEKANASFDAAEFGRFREYFQSPDFAAHIAMLPTGKVLLFSFERIEVNPQKEPAPTDTIGKENAGRAWIWDPAKGTGAGAFTEKKPPVVNMPDGKNEPRPAPFFCAATRTCPMACSASSAGTSAATEAAAPSCPWSSTPGRRSGT